MPELNSKEMGECRKPATTGDILKITDDIFGKVRELNLIISDINSVLINIPMENSEEKESKKGSKGWLEDEYELLIGIRVRMNTTIEKIHLLKSRLGGEK